MQVIDGKDGTAVNICWFSLCQVPDPEAETSNQAPSDDTAAAALTSEAEGKPETSREAPENEEQQQEVPARHRQTENEVSEVEIPNVGRIMVRADADGYNEEVCTFYDDHKQKNYKYLFILDLSKYFTSSSLQKMKKLGSSCGLFKSWRNIVFDLLACFSLFWSLSQMMLTPAMQGVILAIAKARQTFDKEGPEAGLIKVSLINITENYSMIKLLL